jgi:hypothetical protein
MSYGRVGSSIVELDFRPRSVDSERLEVTASPAIATRAVLASGCRIRRIVPEAVHRAAWSAGHGGDSARDPVLHARPEKVGDVHMVKMTPVGSAQPRADCRIA